MVITDLGILRPDPATCELALTELHDGRHRRAGQGGHGLGPEGVRARGPHRAADRRRAGRACERCRRHEQSTDPFVYEALPGRVVFGPGRVAEVGERGGRVRAVAACSSCTTRTPRPSPTTSPRSSASASLAGGARWSSTYRSSWPSGPGPLSPRPGPTPWCASAAARPPAWPRPSPSATACPSWPCPPRTPAAR